MPIGDRAARRQQLVRRAVNARYRGAVVERGGHGPNGALGPESADAKPIAGSHLLHRARSSDANVASGLDRLWPAKRSSLPTGSQVAGSSTKSS